MDFKYLTDSGYSQELTLERKKKNLVKDMQREVLNDESIINEVEYDFENYVFIISFFGSNNSLLNNEFDNYALMIPMEGLQINLATTREYYNDGMQQEIVGNWQDISDSNCGSNCLEVDEIIEHGLEKLEKVRIFILEE